MSLPSKHFVSRRAFNMRNSAHVVEDFPVLNHGGVRYKTFTSGRRKPVCPRQKNRKTLRTACAQPSVTSLGRKPHFNEKNIIT